MFLPGTEGEHITVEELYVIIENRKKNLLKSSYVTNLFKKGDDAILQKIGEEATEIIIAGKNESRERVISEIADLWFHTLILLVQRNIAISDIFSELQKRRVTGTRKNPQP